MNFENLNTNTGDVEKAGNDPVLDVSEEYKKAITKIYEKRLSDMDGVVSQLKAFKVDEVVNLLDIDYVRESVANESVWSWEVKDSLDRVKEILDTVYTQEEKGEIRAASTKLLILVQEMESMLGLSNSGVVEEEDHKDLHRSFGKLTTVVRILTNRTLPW